MFKRWFEFLPNEGNREAIQTIGVWIGAFVAAVWAVFVYFHDPSPPKTQTPTKPATACDLPWEDRPFGTDCDNQ